MGLVMFGLGLVLGVVVGCVLWSEVAREERFGGRHGRSVAVVVSAPCLSRFRGGGGERWTGLQRVHVGSGKSSSKNLESVFLFNPKKERRAEVWQTAPARRRAFSGPADGRAGNLSKPGWSDFYCFE